MHARVPALVVGGIMLMLSTIVVVYSYYHASTYEAATDATSHVSLLSVKRGLEERLIAVVVALTTAIDTCSAPETTDPPKCLADSLDDIAGLKRMQDIELPATVPVTLKPFASTDRFSAGVYLSPDARHLIVAICESRDCTSTRATSRYALDLPGLAMEVPVASKFNSLLLADERGAVLVGWNVPTQLLTRGVGLAAGNADVSDTRASDPWYVYRSPLSIPFVIGREQSDDRASAQLVVLRDRAPVSPMHGVPQGPLRGLFLAICLAPALLPIVSLAVLGRTERVRWWDVRLLVVSVSLICAITVHLYRQTQFMRWLDDLWQDQATIALREFERAVSAKVRAAHGLANALRAKTPDQKGCVKTERLDPIVPASFSVFNANGEIETRLRSDPSTYNRFCKLQSPTSDFSDRHYFRAITRDRRSVAVDIVRSRLSGREDLLVAVGIPCPAAPNREPQCVAAASMPLFPGGMVTPSGVQLALATNDRILMDSQAHRERVERLLERVTNVRDGWCNVASSAPVVVEDAGRKFILQRGQSSLKTIGDQAIDVCAVAIVEPDELDAVQTDSVFDWATGMLLYSSFLAILIVGAIASGAVSEHELGPVSGAGQRYRCGALAAGLVAASVALTTSYAHLGGVLEAIVAAVATLAVAYRYARIPLGDPAALPDRAWRISYAAMIGTVIVMVAGLASWRITGDAQTTALRRWVDAQDQAITRTDQDALQSLLKDGGSRFSAIDRRRLKPILEDPGGKRIDLVHRTCSAALCVSDEVDDPSPQDGESFGPPEPSTSDLRAGPDSGSMRDVAFVGGLWLVLILVATAVVGYLFPDLAAPRGPHLPTDPPSRRIRFYSYSLRWRIRAEPTAVITLDATRPIRDSALSAEGHTTLDVKVIGVERAWPSPLKRRALFDALARLERSTIVDRVELVTMRPAGELLGALQDELSSGDERCAGVAEQRELGEWAGLFATMSEEVVQDEIIKDVRSSDSDRPEVAALGWTQWAQWPLEERFTLVQILDEGVINPRRRADAAALVRRGIVRSLPRLEVPDARVLTTFTGVRSLRGATARWEGRSGSRIRGGLNILFWGAIVIGVIAVQRILPQQHYGIIAVLSSAVMAAAQISSFAEKALVRVPSRTRTD